MKEITLFYLDDDADDRLFFSDAAALCDARTLLFDNPSAFLSALHNPPPVPAVLFVDLNMPIKSGYEIISEIRSHPKFEFFPIVVLSTATNKNCIDKCYMLGASLYLSKPFDFDLLKNCIREIINIDWILHRRTRQNFVCQPQAAKR